VTFLSRTLLRGDAAIPSNFIKEIVLTGPELYFSQSVLLMYGTNCPSLLILVHYRYSYALFAVVSLVCFVYLLGYFQGILCLVVQSFDK